MQSHKGMRPQDIAILLKIIALGKQEWKNKDLAIDLHISPSEISESLSRSQFAGLVNPSKKKVFVLALEEFLVYGLKYIFPAKSGTLVKGMPTAHAAPVLSGHFQSNEIYVWPDIYSSERGMMVEPLYPGAVAAAKKDAVFYNLLALCDVFRLGKVREIKKARQVFQDIFNNQQ